MDAAGRRSPTQQRHAHGGRVLSVERRRDGSVRLELSKDTGANGSAFSSASSSSLSTVLGVVLVLMSALWIAAHRPSIADLDASVMRYPATALAAALVLLCTWPNPIVAEELLVIRDLGIQHGVIRANPALTWIGTAFFSQPHLGRRTSARLIPRDEIMDVVVHEAFRRWSIVSYIAVLTVSDYPTCAGGPDGFERSPAQPDGGAGNGLLDMALQPGGHGGVIVLFPHLRPRLKLVQLAYSEIHKTFF
ncbi:hypothetical protein OC834_005870 [Tilletia horrida]|nr:hypothetical protein OC834_005870 [Tilletia horrida]KAK0531301.1 hypothetical protein OC835_003725 [Tilletia horrida]KAK0558829.1 hypothetical protein OC844_004854 [Tilletia horrida]